MGGFSLALGGPRGAPVPSPVPSKETWFACGEGKMEIGANVRGSDLYVFASASQAGLRAMRDVMAGLQAIDRIDLAAIDADPALAGDQAFTWIGAAAFSGRAGELRVVPGLVQGDLDGDGLADFEIGLEGGVLPGADSFFL